MSKRVTVENSGEPKCKKFEDWEKKYKDVYTSYKSAKRSVPKGAPIIAVPAKKEEADCIAPHLCTFVWTKDLGEMFPMVNLSNGDKSKIMIYDRFTLGGKNECSWYAPLFNPIDFIARQFPSFLFHLPCSIVIVQLLFLHIFDKTSSSFNILPIILSTYFHSVTRSCLSWPVLSKKRRKL